MFAAPLRLSSYRRIGRHGEIFIASSQGAASMLRLVWVWPAMGFPDRPWLDHPDEDTFARSANRSSSCTARRYARRGSRRATRNSGCSAVTTTAVTTCWHGAPGDDRGLRKRGSVLAPPGIAALTPPARADVVLLAVEPTENQYHQRGQSVLKVTRAIACSVSRRICRHRGPRWTAWSSGCNTHRPSVATNGSKSGQMGS